MLLPSSFLDRSFLDCVPPGTLLPLLNGLGVHGNLAEAVGKLLEALGRAALLREELHRRMKARLSHPIRGGVAEALWDGRDQPFERVS